MSADVDATTSVHLRNQYAIVGVGETTYRRGSEETTRNLATWAINNALDDAGLEADDVDGMLSYSGNDSTFSTVRGRRPRHPAELLHGRASAAGRAPRRSSASPSA